MAAVQQAAHHILRDLLGSERIKLVPGRKLKTAIRAVHRGFEPGLHKVGRLNHDHAGNAAWPSAAGWPLRSHQSEGG
jgi:hypothetical protein